MRVERVMRVLSVVSVVVLVLTVAACSDDSDEDAETSGSGSTAAAVAVFEPESDDLCEWMTGDEVVEILQAAGAADVEAPAVASSPDGDDPLGWDCVWTVAPGYELQLGARSSGQDRPDIPDNYTRTGQVMQPGGGPVAGHPALSEGVIVENQAFGRFSFFVVDTDHQLNLLYSYWEGSSDEEFETVLMSTADAVLAELGWLPS